ncbi:MAG TPA: outer-membrane lipoprotein carrier protein LolA [Pyrinomonadaceae bacterium]|nr:outer-membrane lipoprotein carrier protein LolA [Pyrinomonadaceae bacterium]
MNSILNRMDTHYKALSSLRSTIEVDQLTSQSGQTRQLQGKLVFLPKTPSREMHTRMDWKLPRVEHLAVIGDSFTLYRPGLEMVIKDKIDNPESVSFAASALSFGRISKVQMKATYTIEYFGQEEITGKVPTWHLRLSPKPASVNPLTELWVDANGMVRVAKISAKNGDTTTVRLIDIEKNIKMGLDDFRISYHGSIKPVSAAVAEISLKRSLNTALTRMDNHHRSLSSIAADINTDRSNFQLGDSDVSQGTLVLLPKKGWRQMYARIDWIKPRAENIAVIGDEYMLYKPNVNAVYRGKISKVTTLDTSGGVLAFMGMSRVQIEKNYQVELIDREKMSGGIRTARLRITPASGKFKYADLWVDGAGMVRQVKVTETNNDTNSVLLYNIRKNIKVNADVFIMKVPKGAKIIKG